MERMKIEKISMSQAPKAVRRKAVQVRNLWAERNIKGLRKLRDSSEDMELAIFHHSQGTDAYFHDLEGKYYTWDQLEKLVNAKIMAGKVYLTVIIPHKPGYIFNKSSVQPNPSEN